MFRYIKVGVVDAINKRGICSSGGRGDDDHSRACREVCRSLVALSEKASRLDHHVNTQLLPRQLGWVSFRKHLQLLAIDHDAVIGRCHRVGKHTHHRVVLQQVSHRLFVAQVVDSDDVDIGPVFLHRPPKAAPNTTKTVDAYTYCHG